jgi:predicted hydrocarbon binding protein
MRKLGSLVTEEERKAIMTGCACQYPTSALQDIRAAYEESAGDIDLAHRLLQERFEAFLVESLALEDELVEEIVGRGWGLAGILQGDTIIATKIPKSGYLVEYMEETDPGRRRELYCHCPRIRDVLQTSHPASSGALGETYCYCGAGFYKGIWEEILQAPVDVEVLESVLKGDDVCKIAIRVGHRGPGHSRAGVSGSSIGGTG